MKGRVSLSVRLVLLVLIAAFPAIALLVWNHYDLRQGRLQELERQVLAQATQQAGEIDRIAEGALQFLVALAQVPDVAGNDPRACIELLTRIRENYRAYRALIKAERDGSVLCSSIGPGPSIEDRAYFRLAVDMDGFAIGEYAEGRGTKAPGIHFAYPIRDAADQVTGVIAAALNLDWFAAELGEKLPAGAALTVTDRNGTIVVHLPDNETWRGKTISEEFRRIIHSPKPGVVHAAGAGGVRQVLGYTPIGVAPDGFYVGIARNWDAAVADLNRAMLRGAALIAGGLIVSLGLALLWSEYGIRRPVHNLLTLVGRWRQGNYAPSGATWDRSEFGRLGQAVEDLALAVADRERRLRESEARLKQREAYLSFVLDHVPAGIMQTGPDGRYLFANRAFCELVGRPRNELLTLKFADITHPDDVAADTERFAEAIGTRQPYTHRKRYVRPDGSVVWTENTVTHLDQPAEGVLATSVELTERMRAEQDQQRLINELNHRVKNTLASVQALMVMTDRYAESKQAFVHAFSARLKALSLTHDLLTERLWQGASLRDVIRSELEPYAAGHPERIAIEGEAVQLSPRRAISLGMVFHELATNAAKYGALSAQAGRVFVHWGRSGGDAPVLRLEWREENGPKVAPVSRRGFGSRLIEQSIAELDGTVKMEFDPSGLRCTMEIDVGHG